LNLEMLPQNSYKGLAQKNKPIFLLLTLARNSKNMREYKIPKRAKIRTDICVLISLLESIVTAFFALLFLYCFQLYQKTD
jgi:hypothetical protein